MQDVKMGNNIEGKEWCLGTVLFADFFCKPKTALKIKSINYFKI